MLRLGSGLIRKHNMRSVPLPAPAASNPKRALLICTDGIDLLANAKICDLAPEIRPHGYLCSNDYRDVIETLKGWGALRSIVSMQ
jgi:hypothetical protein